MASDEVFYNRRLLMGVSVSRIKRNLIGSTSYLNAVFDAIDQNVFNCNLDGVKLEWCDMLKSRAALTYQQATMAKKQVYIRCSKTYLKGYTRKRFVEVILYEMVCLYLAVANGSIESMDDGLQMNLLKSAFEYLNTHYGTNLKINNNYTTNNDSSDVKSILDLLAAERRFNMKKPSDAQFRATASMHVLTKKLFGSSEDYDHCREVGTLYRQHFFGSNIMAIYVVKDDIKCVLCEQELSRNALGHHLNNECSVFDPLSA